MVGRDLIAFGATIKFGIAQSSTVSEGSLICFLGDTAVASNGYIIVQVPFNSGIFEGMVNGTMADVLVSLDPEQVFEVVATDDRLILQNDKIDMTYMKVGEQKEYNIFKESLKEILLPVNIFQALKKVLSFVGIREVIPALRGVCIRKDGVMASDNIRIVRVRLQQEIDTELLIPAEGVSRLVELAEGRILKEVSIVEDKNYLRFVFQDGVVAYILLFGLTFPALESHVSSVLGQELDIPQGFVEGLRRAVVWQSDMEKTIELVISKNILCITSQGLSGAYKQNFILNTSIEDIRCVVNGGKFLELCELAQKMYINQEVIYLVNVVDNIIYAMMTME